MAGKRRGTATQEAHLLTSWRVVSGTGGPVGRFGAEMVRWRQPYEPMEEWEERMPERDGMKEVKGAAQSSQAAIEAPHPCSMAGAALVASQEAAAAAVTAHRWRRGVSWAAALTASVARGALLPPCCWWGQTRA